MTRFDATEPNHHNRSGQFIWYIKRSTQFVIDSFAPDTLAYDPTDGLIRTSCHPSPYDVSVTRDEQAHRRPSYSMTSLLWLISSVINIYVWCIIISAILSWLVAFNVVNTQNRIIYLVGDTLYRITDPLLRPIRRFMPNLGGIDISPIILILVLFFIRSLLFEYWPR